MSTAKFFKSYYIEKLQLKVFQKILVWSFCVTLFPRYIARPIPLSLLYKAVF